MNDGQIGVLAWLKGPALAIFLAVGRADGVGPSELSELTGWGRNATYDALRKLSAAGWIDRNRRGCWLLTVAGRAAWAELVGGGAPRAGSAVPPSGTVIHNAVPPSGTVIHSPEGDAPAKGANVRSSVPRNGTKYGEHVPANGAQGRPSVPRNGTKSRQQAPANRAPSRRRVPRNGTTAPHDHDDDLDRDDQETKIIINTLKAMQPKFDDAEKWLATVDKRLVMPWYHWIRRSGRADRNPTGYLRRCVESGRLPPQPRGQPAERERCPVCGHSYWLDGECLVCTGVVRC